MRNLRHVSFYCCLVVLFTNAGLYAQNADTSKVKTTILERVTIQAYGSQSLLNTPAAVTQIKAQQLNRYANVNILAAINATPGVRMEERSFGSYRLNIRGSSVRSPYGVRNVKLYYEDIPFTAPGGNSMLNMLGFANIGSLSIIRSAGGSLYGAGTGGVVLINAPVTDTSIFANAGSNSGSFGALGFTATVNYKNQAVVYEQQEAEGYREHTEMSRKVIAYNGQLLKSKSRLLKIHFLYSDLNYQTPGALTLTEYQVNPKAARPAAGPNPGAIQAKAGIHQQATLLGLNQRYVFSDYLENTTTVYGFYNKTENPAIQNFEDKKEPHGGGRSVFSYALKRFSIQFGGEFQYGDFSYTTYQNTGGKRGALRTDDEIKIGQWMGFSQVNWQYQRWLLTAGASLNSVNFNFKRSNANPAPVAKKDYAVQIQPRFAVLYQLNPQFSFYVNVVKGFSPPASSEIFADNNSLNLALQPEKGWTFEPGFRGSLGKRAVVDVSIFSAKLSNSIVTRRDAAGANYFLNAGKIEQQGIETALSYRAWAEEKPLALLLSAAHTWHHFRYLEFVQTNQDFSGNSLPGVPPHSYSIMVDLKHKSGLFAYGSFSHTDKIPLNDANAQFANSYQLLSAKLGVEKIIRNMYFHLYVGAENLLNQTYSLGNDINGFGDRFYNVAPARSFYVGLKLGLTKAK